MKLYYIRNVVLQRENLETTRIIKKNRFIRRKTVLFATHTLVGIK